MESDVSFIPQLVESIKEQINTSAFHASAIAGAETNKNTHNTINSQNKDDQNHKELFSELFTDSFCKVCGAVLQYESQRISHYEGKKHAQKVKLFFQMQKDKDKKNAKNEQSNFRNEGVVDKNRFCSLCNMVFSSPVVAQSHYAGKVHAKYLKKFGGEKLSTALTPPAAQSQADNTPTEAASSMDPSVVVPELVRPEERCGEPGSEPAPSGVDLNDSSKYCKLCSASFNNSQMAQQHYSGKKHLRNETRRKLLQDLGEEAVPADSDSNDVGVSTFICPICSITLSSIEMYQAHMQGNKHQIKETKVANLMKNTMKKVYDSFQDELDDYIQVQKARGLAPKTSNNKGREGFEDSECAEEDEAGNFSLEDTGGPWQEETGEEGYPNFPMQENNWFMQGKCVEGVQGFSPKTQRRFRKDNFAGIAMIPKFAPQNMLFRPGPCGKDMQNPGFPPFGQPEFQAQPWGPPFPPSWEGNRFRQGKFEEEAKGPGFSPKNRLLRKNMRSHRLQAKAVPSGECKDGSSFPSMDYRPGPLAEPRGVFQVSPMYPPPPENIPCYPYSAGVQPQPAAFYKEGIQELSSHDSDDDYGHRTSEDAGSSPSRRVKRKHRKERRPWEDSDREEERARHKRRKRHQHTGPGKERKDEVEEKEGEVTEEKPAKEEKAKHKGKEGKPKHKKDKKKKEELDGRTEEEKLWDESIMGLM
ncbi:zinc finger matrin-type protein 1-like [Polyodon spathula]|uniref:zinc finger matrin-type protein 1-like n=1 Tax=Polyodon spathula TaxID=7913 RepID=UPI001B7ED689|nr:zinc finger matrin-type protein 1-like [Polyodon spathula]